MQLLLLTGLVTVEKIDLTRQLAAHFAATGERVAVLDNISRLHIDPNDLPAAVSYQRINRPLDFTADLSHLGADRVLLALSETAEPNHTFTALLDLPSGVDVTTLALIDTRTCDCFPAMRATLEDYADLTVNLPYVIEDVIAKL